mmetsp:Transcript_66317/g.194491  ORF Transcript_66317/g.194491 Transcript_66317/m.194491 type:complete len:215 (+) Transcript_66317:77-721(+)
MGKGSMGDRVELVAPPHVWISWGVLLSYAVVFVEGVTLSSLHWISSDASAELERVGRAQFHLCAVYMLEAVLAVGPGWCAMSPGWTCSELLMHHVPYAMATALAFFGGHAHRWIAPMLVVLLTPLNEGLFIVHGLGAPEWTSQFRRLFGFCIVAILLLVETAQFFRNSAMNWERGSAGLPDFLIDNLVWGGIYYHALLLKLYLRRWKKTGSLIR